MERFRSSLRMEMQVVLSLLLIAVCIGTSPQRAIAVSLDYTAAGKVTDTKIQYDNLPRRVLYYIPKNFTLKAKHPLIFIIHGFNQPIETIVSGYGTEQAKADADGTILVYPGSTGSFEKRSLAWNTRYGSYSKTTFPEVDKVDDIGFFSYLIDLFVSELNCDPDRVYVTGMSLGGAMTYTLSCYIPEKLAAIAPVIMQMGTRLAKQCTPAKPLPVMIINGTADPLVPNAGNNQDPATEWLPILSINDTISFWKIRNGITGSPTKTDLPNPVTEVFKGKETPSNIEKYVWSSPNGNEIIWLKVMNGGHWLPTYAGGKALDASNLGGFDGSYMGNYNCDYDASGGIYDFLLSHTRK